MNSQWPQPACACGCGTPLSGKQRLYASNACKSRHWKAQHGYALSATYERCQTPRKRSSGAPGLQVSYRRAVMAMAVCLSTGYGVPVEEAQTEAEGYMRYILSDKQRARLDARG